MSEARPQKAALDARVLLPIVLLIATVTYLWAALGIRSPYQDVGVGPSFFPIVVVFPGPAEKKGGWSTAVFSQSSNCSRASPKRPCVSK